MQNIKETDPSQPVCESLCEKSPESLPMGVVGPGADRDGAGRFVAGNRASLIVGQRSVAFWEASRDALRQIRDDVVADAGFTVEDAPRALLLAAEGIAQQTLIRDSAFDRVTEAGGPLTTNDRTRRAHKAWESATDRLDRSLRLVGLKRVAREISFADRIRAAAAANQRERERDAEK